MRTYPMELPIVFGSDPALVGMKLWLPIDEGAGSRFNNLIDSQNPGLMTGGSWSGGRPALDGTDDLITLRRVPVTDFTAIIHYTPTGVSGISPVFDQGDILIRQSDDDMLYGATNTLNTDSTDTLTAALTAGQPIAIAVTRSGTTMTIWGFTRSGVATASFTVSGTPLTSNTNIIIGSDSRESFAFVDLVPANLTTEKGILITANDTLEISTGSVSLNSAVVTENWNANQLTVLMWVKLNFAPGDGLTHQLISNNVGGGNGIAAFIFTDGVLYFDVTDKDALLHRFSSSITGWSAGDWHQVVLRLDFKNDEAELYVDGASVDSTPTNPFSGDSIDAIESDTDIGHAAGALQLNGATTLLIEGRSWSNAEITANWNAGAGTPFVVSSDTLALGNYSDGVTSITYHHSGYFVTNTVNAANETAITIDGTSGDNVKDGDDMVLQDATGYSVPVVADGDWSAGGGDVDDGAGALVTDIERVGVALFMDAAYNAVAVDNTVHDITTEDIGFNVSMKVSEDDNGNFIFSKEATSAGYYFRVAGGGVTIFLISDGTDTYHLTGNTDLRDGKWHTCAGVIDKSNAANCELYLDGVIDTASKTGTLGDVGDITSTRILAIGSRASGANKTNAIFRDLLLTYPADIMGAGELGEAGAILALATNPLAVASQPNSEDYWPCTEGTGTTINGAVNNLTLSNAAAWSQEARISHNRMLDIENGGVGGHTPGDAASIISKSSVEVFKDSLSLKVLNGDASQAFDRLTIATVANADYRFFGRFFSPTTLNGASRLVDVDLTAALGITVTQAGLSAGWNDVEFTFEAADTSTTIDLGSSSVTNTEFGYWDDVRVEANLVTQPGCEAADGNSLPTGWSDTGSPAADETQTDDAEQHSGLTSILLNNCDADEGVTQDVTVVVDEYYTFSMWEKNNAQDVNVVLSGAATATIDITGDNTWTKHPYSFKASTTTLTIKVTSGAANQSTWVDDFVLFRNDTAAASTADRLRSFADGKVESVAVWDRAMTFEEVQARKDEI